MPDVRDFAIILVPLALLVAAQAWFLPFGFEKAEPRASRTGFAVLSVVFIVCGLAAAHALLPSWPNLAGALGAVAGVLLMKMVRARFASASRVR